MSASRLRSLESELNGLTSQLQCMKAASPSMASSLLSQASAAENGGEGSEIEITIKIKNLEKIINAIRRFLRGF